MNIVIHDKYTYKVIKFYTQIRSSFLCHLQKKKKNCMFYNLHQVGTLCTYFIRLNS